MQKLERQQGTSEHSLNGSKPKTENPEQFSNDLVVSAEDLSQAARNLLNKVLLQKGIKEKEIKALEGRVNWKLKRRNIYIPEGNYSLNELALIGKAYDELKQTQEALRKLRQFLPSRKSE